jgi:threonine/homoserine/homoserine lactone efflux protein
MSLEVWLTYVLACFVVIIVPGPTVTVIVANSVRYGPRAGLANVAGTQAGMGVALLVLIAGLASVMEFISEWFYVLKLGGACYLIWLGAKLWLSDGKLVTADVRSVKGGFFLQGFVVAVTNPKVLLFFGAFIPQFVDPRSEAVYQLAVLGLTFMLVATIFDAVYAILAGRAGIWLSTTRVRLIERFSGTLLIGGGLWLALTRR